MILKFRGHVRNTGKQQVHPGENTLFRLLSRSRGQCPPANSSFGSAGPVPRTGYFVPMRVGGGVGSGWEVLPPPPSSPPGGGDSLTADWLGSFTAGWLDSLTAD